MLNGGESTGRKIEIGLGSMTGSASAGIESLKRKSNQVS